jgi:peptide/nickel transport system substrate-binding protein
MRLKSFVNVLDQGIAGLPSPLWAQRLATIARTGYLRICGSVGHASHAVAAIIIVANCLAAAPAAAQKHGGTLRVYISANPSSLSILEEVSFTTVMAAGPVFNGLVVFDPMQPIGGIDTVIPEL